MRSRITVPKLILPVAIILIGVACLSPLIRSGFRESDRKESGNLAKEPIPKVHSEKEYDPFADPPMDPPVFDRDNPKIKVKFVEGGSGTEELAFDWIVAPFGSDVFGADIPALLDVIECDRRDMTESMQRVADTEAKDRVNYSPVSFEVVPIVMRNPGEGYHGPTKGTYIFIVEEYPSAEAAARRAAEYLDPGYRQRIANPDSLEEESKSSVRCWGIAEGKSAYLLTTHAFQFRALESLTHDLKRKLAKHTSGETGR